MAIEVVKRPEGHKIIDQAIAADISDSGGDALVTFPYHSLTDGDYVYIASDIDEYNGFWWVDVITASTFKLREYEDADPVEFYQNLEIDYYRTQPHFWNSIFLPIVYKIHNTRWPANLGDFTRTISSFSNDNGYTDVQASGSLKLSVQALEYIKISGATNDDYNGVWQIAEVISTSHLVLNMPYSGSSGLAGASIQFYYNSYQLKVKIFAGLPAGHPWEAKKPYEEVGELSLTPDADNIVMFSVSDYIKSKIVVRNNTTLFSLPLNLDAFTGFYIAFSETYDNSDGYTLTTEDSLAFEEDTFEGYAVAGKLPFKNLYSGDYADYIYTSGSPALWLTNMERLLAVEGLYFDVSFIKNITGDFTVTINKYVADYLTSVELIEFTDQGIGVYRIPIEVDSQYDSFCIKVDVDGAPGESTEVQEIADWSNAGGPFPGVSWDYASFGYPWASVNGNGGVEGYTVGVVPTVAGTTYAFTVLVEVGDTGSSTPITKFIFALLDAGYNEIETVEFNYTDEGLFLENFEFTPSSNGTYLGLRVQNDTPVDTKNMYLRFASGGTGEQFLLNPEFVDSSEWTNVSTGTSWTIGGGSMAVSLASGNSKYASQSFGGSGIGNYLLISEYTSTNFDIGTDSLNLVYEFLDIDDNVITSQVVFISGNNTSPVSYNFTSAVAIARIRIRAIVASGANMDISVAFAYLYGPMEVEPGINATVTEEICIDIIGTCDAQGGFTPTDRRLLEDGGYRLLE